MSELLGELPARTVPVILMDANARVGSVNSSSIGLCNADTENTNGLMFREMLEEHHLDAINTFFDCSPTYYHGDGISTARVDYICSTGDVRG
eukprot:6070787-Pyramimonas_sp.AAC.1